MYSFRNDYSEGTHEKILEALQKTNLEQTIGYGCDEYCAQAEELIKKESDCPEAQVFFVSGGTQANLLVISSLLRPHQAVVAAHTGHINVHETGAVEATGHKVLTVNSDDGKVTPEKIAPLLAAHCDEHMVKPAMVYISNSTEVGTLYNKKELSELREFCLKNGLLLFMDGARLGSALCSPKSDLTLADIAALTDIFYIGGTKNGALFGEAVVITKKELSTDFRFLIKQRGAMLAKGRIAGLQFKTLFTDRLFYRIAEHANTQAFALKKGIADLGYEFLSDSYTNQQFVVLPLDIKEKLAEEFDFEVWGSSDVPQGKVCIRLVTSWATDPRQVERFLEYLGSISKTK